MLGLLTVFAICLFGGFIFAAEVAIALLPIILPLALIGMGIRMLFRR